MKPFLDPDPVERALEALICCLALCVVFTGCTHVVVSGPSAPAPALEAKQLGGMLTMIAPDGTHFSIDNRQSLAAVTEAVDNIAGKVTILQGTKEAIGLRRAKNASDAATAQSQIRAGTEAQRIAADQAIASQKLTNEAAAAALAAP